MKSSPGNSKRERGGWAYLAARVLVCATFPLIFVGGLVTTYQAGMAVPDWPSTYGYNLFLYPWSTWWSGPFDLFVEHGHRLLGATVGLLTLVVAGLVWRSDPRRSARTLALAAVVLVILQGVLGGARVLLDDYLLARIHGCTAPLFFAVAVSLSTVLSPRWRAAGLANSERSSKRQARSVQPALLAAVTTLLIYVQIVLGAHVRHLAPWATPQSFRAFVWFHLLLAAAITTFAFALPFVLSRSGANATGYQRRPAMLLPLLLLVQLFLGAATWVVQFGYPLWMQRWTGTEGFLVEAESLGQSLVTTAHVAMGSLLLGVSLTASLRIGRATWLALARTHEETDSVWARRGVPA